MRSALPAHPPGTVRSIPWRSGGFSRPAFQAAASQECACIAGAPASVATRDPTPRTSARPTGSWGAPGGLLTLIARDLRYPSDRPQRPAQEKGIDVALAVDLVMTVARDECDVAIVFSSDTDLLPALEAVLALRPGEPPVCEVAAWAPSAGRPRSLSVRSLRLRRHLLSEADFRAVADDTDYTVGR